MKPKIDNTEFGSITIDNETHIHDVYITSDGEIKKRKKKLSKEITGTSHVVSVDEIKYILGMNVEALIVGSGQYGVLTLSKEALTFLEDQNCKVKILPTVEAIKYWNDFMGNCIGLFHVTC